MAPKRKKDARTSGAVEQHLVHPSDPAFASLHPATRAVHADGTPDARTGALTVPIFATSTYRQHAPAVHDGYDYSRADNPTREALERALAVLERGKGALCYASGMAAITTVTQLLSSGDHVVLSDDVYGGTFRLFAQVLGRQGIAFTTADLTRAAGFEGARSPRTKLVIAESPSNPLLKVVDLRALAEQTHAAGALLLIDNTFASPVHQSPLALGADIVVHSTTKYLGGHSDLIGGALVGDDPQLLAQLKFLQKAVGAVPSPFDCFLTLRGIKTLHVRMARHSANALALARMLQEHPKVSAVHYPGLPSDPGHAIAASQMQGGFSGMLSFETVGGLADATAMVRGCRVFTLAESLGGVESLIEHPALMTHASLPPDVRAAQGIGDTLIRLSVGIEDLADLQKDLQTGLRRVQGRRRLT